MAIKITTQIGTDKGITNEAYVRIADYQVSKHGSASFRIELFSKQEDASPVSGPTMGTNQARNQQIGESIWVALTKQVDATRTVKQNVEVLTDAVLDSNGDVVTPSSSTWELQDVEETYSKTAPDLSPLETGTIFAFGYTKLKEKLTDLFGAENIVDC
jgi:hypothetical protein